jgi:hypothetical protein
LHPTATGFREFHETQQGTSGALATSWDDFAGGSLMVNREWKNNIEEWATSFFLEKFIFILGAVTIGGPATALIWVAGELGDLTDIRLPGELGAIGLVAAEGVFVLAGPIFFLPVFIAGVLVSAALFKRRRLSSEEKDELTKVFGGTLDYDKIWITNLEGVESRPFTFFNLDEEVVVGASPKFFPDFDNLLKNNMTKWFFVHELTHAWQYQHRRFLTRLCQIVKTRSDEVLLGKDEVYQYTAGGDWDKYNMEQQANIVSDWYSKKINGYQSQYASKDADKVNERYIRENILMEQS